MTAPSTYHACHMPTTRATGSAQRHPAFQPVRQRARLIVVQRESYCVSDRLRYCSNAGFKCSDLSRTDPNGASALYCEYYGAGS